MEQFKNNGESQRALMEIIVNEIRENRKGIKDINNILRSGEGKIAENRSAIRNLKWAFGIGVTIVLTVLGWGMLGG